MTPKSYRLHTPSSSAHSTSTETSVNSLAKTHRASAVAGTSTSFTATRSGAPSSSSPNWRPDNVRASTRRRGGVSVLRALPPPPTTVLARPRRVDRLRRRVRATASFMAGVATNSRTEP